jgi:hypothetical protein
LIFTDASLLVIGAALTGLILVGLWSHGVRRRKLARFLGGRRALDRVSRSDLSRFGVRRTVLLGLAGLALAGAAADPHWNEATAPPAPIKRAILAVDVSASMQATDDEPTRLARATDLARHLLDDLEGHHAGLVLYAGQSYPLAPPTYDLNAIRFLLDGVTPTMASSYDPGTLMSAGIDEALALLARDSAATADPAAPAPQDLIVFISDGDAEGDDPELEAALARAEEAGVTIHAVGIGGDRGSNMVLPRGTYQLGGPVVDASGAPGVTRLDESALRALAAAGGGLYAYEEDAGSMRTLDQELLAPTVPPDPDPVDAPPPWAAYDLPFLLGAFALACVFLESLIGMTLPRLRSVRTREAT